jgi:hypothetical protein
MRYTPNGIELFPCRGVTSIKLRKKRLLIAKKKRGLEESKRNNAFYNPPHPNPSGTARAGFSLTEEETK